jgi:hypothetical protein
MYVRTMYVCVYVCIVCVCIYIYVCKYVCMYVCVNVRMYICMYLLCIYVCKCECMYIYVCMYVLATKRLKLRHTSEMLLSTSSSVTASTLRYSHFIRTKQIMLNDGCAVKRTVKVTNSRHVGLSSH